MAYTWAGMEKAKIKTGVFVDDWKTPRKGGISTQRKAACKGDFYRAAPITAYTNLHMSMNVEMFPKIKKRCVILLCVRKEIGADNINLWSVALIAWFHGVNSLNSTQSTISSRTDILHHRVVDPGYVFWSKRLIQAATRASDCQRGWWAHWGNDGPILKSMGHVMTLMYISIFETWIPQPIFKIAAWNKHYSLMI